jgi:hypothetical protein
MIVDWNSGYPFKSSWKRGKQSFHLLKAAYSRPVIAYAEGEFGIPQNKLDAHQFIAFD